jgi:hypothetical protein
MIGLIFLIISSCKKDFNFDKVKDPKWNPDFMIPLVDDSISFESAITIYGEEKNFYIDEEGDVSLLYYFRNEAFNLSASDLLILPPFTFSFNHEITPDEQEILKIQDFIISPITFTINLSEEIPNVIIEKLLIKKGAIIINSNISYSNEGYLIISILNATINGTPFSDTIRPFISGNSCDTIDLSNILFDLSSTPNSITLQINGLLKKSNELVVGDMMNSDFNIVISQIGRFEGFLGQMTFPEVEESVKVTIFNNAYTTGNIYFVDPSASVSIINSIGTPIENVITGFRATNTTSGISLDIADRLGENAIITMESPDININPIVIKTVDYSNENTENSMDDFFEVKPDHVFFKIKTTLNPDGQAMNYFSDTSSLYAILKVRLPLFGHFDNLYIQDTFGFSIANQKDIEMFEFKMHIVNGFPLQAKMQIYFIDGNYNELDSLTENIIIPIKEAPVDPSTYLPIPGMFGVKDTSFFFDQQKIERIENAENIVIKAILQSAEEGQLNVKIKAAQSLRLNFSALVQLRKN